METEKKKGTPLRWRIREEIFPPDKRVFPRERKIHSFSLERITEDRLKEKERHGRF